MTAQPSAEEGYKHARALIKRISRRVRDIAENLEDTSYADLDPTKYIDGWDHVVTYCGTESRLPLLDIVDRLLCVEYPLLTHFMTVEEYLKNHSAIHFSAITAEHFAAFWSHHEALYASDDWSSLMDKEALLELVLEDPSREPVMSAIVSDRGVISADTMLELLDIIGKKPTSLLEGVL